MDTQLTVSRWVGAARAALATVAAALTIFALTLVLKRVDAAIPQARDAVLGLLGVALILTAGALDAQEPEDRTPDREPAPDTEPAESTSWHEYEGSFRGMVG
jgi:hypothetical protein